MSSSEPSSRRKLLTRGFVGIVLATFFSDVGHEMATAVLPLYLGGLAGSVALGAAALGTIEGIADLCGALAKLSGGIVGHRVRKKLPLAVAGYALTAIGTTLIAAVKQPWQIAPLRALAWIGRGFRSPLRDFLLSDEVGPEMYGRAYGFERSADSAGAVLGPLFAALLVWAGLSYGSVIWWSAIPSTLAAISFAVLVRDKPHPTDAKPATERAKLPKEYWLFLVGVLLFGLGDFARSFLIVLAASALGGTTSGVLTTSVLLYAGHNLVSAFAAYPVGILGDRMSKPKILIAGYALGVATNALFATSTSLPVVIAAIALSGIYIAIEETVEKAVVASQLTRETRTLGLGILATANAFGDFGSSLFVGTMVATGHTTLAFAIPACVGALGVLWLTVIVGSGKMRG